MSRAGKKTGEFGKWLYHQCRENYPQFKVYYDHGEKNHDPNVSVPMGFFGDNISQKNRLTDCDVLVGLSSEENSKAVLLIEVEQGSNKRGLDTRSVSPKTVLGDILASMLSERFAIKTTHPNSPHDYYQVDEETLLIIAFPYNERGYTYPKMKMIEKTIQNIVKSNEKPLKNVELVMAPNLKELFNQLKQITKKRLKEYTNQENIIHIGGNQKDNPKN